MQLVRTEPSPGLYIAIWAGVTGLIQAVMLFIVLEPEAPNITWRMTLRGSKPERWCAAARKAADVPTHAEQRSRPQQAAPAVRHVALSG